jgi:hypothetical protein
VGGGDRRWASIASTSAGVILAVERHRAGQLRPVRANPDCDRAFDLSIAPITDTVFGAGGDVASDGFRPRLAEIRQFAATLVGAAHIERPVGPRRRMAQHTMADRPCKIAAIGELVCSDRFVDVRYRRPRRVDIATAISTNLSGERGLILSTRPYGVRRPSCSASVQ